MRNKLLTTTSIAAVTIAAGLATSAFAPTAIADGYEPVGMGVAPRPVVKWGGFYVGGHVGWGRADMDGLVVKESANASGPLQPVLFDSMDPEGILGGVHAGYNWQHGRMVFGIEGDWDFMDWDDRALPVDPTNSGKIDVEVDNIASVRARIGVTVLPDHSGLLFVNAGAAWADASGRICPGTDTPCSDPFNFDFDDVGGVVGGGFEYAVTNHFRLRLDGSYYWFDDDNVQERRASGGRSEAHLDFDDVYTFRVGGTFYFNKRPQFVALK